MSITSRINEMSSHIEQAYDELQGLGADLTNVNKNIDNISMVLDDIYDSMPQVSGEGTSLTLDNTRVGKIKSTLKGNTSQDGTPTPTTPIPVNVVSGDNEIQVCGKNICFTDFGDWESGEYNSSGNKGNNTSRVRTKDLLIVRQSTTYFLDSSSSNDSFIVREYDKNKTFIKNDGIITNGGNITTMSNCYFLGITLFSNTNQTRSYEIYQTLFEEGSIKPFICLNSVSDKTYEPYIGNTYNIDLPVENLLDLTSLNPNQVGQQVSNIQENSFIMSGTAVWGNEYFFYENTNKNTTYTASCKYLSSLARKSGLSIYGTNETTGENLTTINSLLVDIPANVETPVTNTFNSGNYDYIVFRYWNNATATALSSRVDLYVKEVQLEKGSKQNSFTPYGTTPIEMCSSPDGTKRDYFLHDKTLDKWYLHKEIGKVVLNGTETIDIYNQNTNRTNFQVDVLTGIESYLGNYDVPNLLSNMFNVVSQSATWVVGNISRRREAQTTLYLTYKPNTTIEAFKTWLASNNVSCYYIYAIPTNTEITYQPLIDQLNELEKAMSKDGQTNISQVNNDLPFIISASALKEWQESTSLNSTLSMVNPLSLGNTLNTQENDIQPIEVDNIEPLEEGENE